jgi:putative spermidine/putrescine transport system permease protein
MAPILILVATSFTASDTVSFPPTKLSLRWYVKLANHLIGAPGLKSGLATAIRVSIEVASLATAMATVAGVAAAYCFQAVQFRGQQALQQMFMLPVVLPQLVTGVGLLLLFSEFGLTDAHYRLFFGHALLVLPYVLLTVSATLQATGVALEEAAIGLGASRIRAFFLVTLPLLAPTIAAAALFAFVISFNTFTLSYFLYSGQGLPLPIWLFEYMTYFQDPMLAALSTVLIIGSIFGIGVLDRLVGLRRAAGT